MRPWSRTKVTIKTAVAAVAAEIIPGLPLTKAMSTAMEKGQTGRASRYHLWASSGIRYLAVVIDLFFRRVIGWSMQGRTYADLALQVLLPLVDCNAINCRAMDGRLAAQTKDQGPCAF